MKIIYLMFVLGLFAISCEEDFNPYGDFKEKYILNCILRGDSTSQILFLSKSYNPANFNSSLITDDVSIKNADVKILIGDSVYFFKDSTINRSDTVRYKTPLNFYFNDKLELIPNKDIEVEVLLSSGRRIRSSTKAPPKILFDQRSSDVISNESSNIFQFIWNVAFTGQFFYPKMVITYAKKKDGISTIMTKEVPINYNSNGGHETPVYPGISVQSILNIQKQSITKALEEISQGDPNKQNYTIYEFAVVNVLAFDQNLSRYYSTTNGSLDDLTVRVDENDFTNVDGGYGIFTSYLEGEYKIKFLPTYVQSFGYNILIGN